LVLIGAGVFAVALALGLAPLACAIYHCGR